MATTTTTTTTVVTNTDGEPQRFGDKGTMGMRARWVMAGFSLIAAGIHFGFASDHWAEDWRHGLFFMVLGWLQLIFAVLIVTRPSRALLAAGIALSAGTIGVWAISRTVGLPTMFGGDGEKEPMALADQLASILEGAIIVGSAALLSAPAWVAQGVRSRGLASGATAGVMAVALVAGSMSLTPRYTSGHDHGAGGHDHGTEAAASADGHDHAATATDATATATDGHDHGATGAAHDHTTAGPYAAGESPCEKSTAAFPSDAGEDADPTSGHNHPGALPQEPIDAATRDKLAAEQVEARSAVAKYPTVAEATADGYRLSTVYLPCIGAHYTKVSLVGEFNAATPSELLYDGTKPDSKIIGLSYLLVHTGGPPEGFAGPNDVWHQHSKNGGLCLNNVGVVIGGEQMSKATCEKRGGRKSGLKDIWMVHDWVAPGWECGWGVFAAECPELGGRPGGTSSSPLN